MTTNQSVLVVDDIPGFRSIICEMLDDLGFSSYIEASDGLEAYQKAKEVKPILIISDYMMSPKTGMDLLELLKGDAELKEVPFILVSAVAEQAVYERALSLGASGYIPRPIGFDKLKQTVVNALNQSASPSR